MDFWKLFWLSLLVVDGSTHVIATPTIVEQPLDPVEIEVEEVVEDESEIEWLIPCSTSDVKTYMDYQAITVTTSKQYQFIQANMSIHNGLLYDSEGYIGVALGSWWGSIGDRWLIELDTGIELKVVMVDYKADQHVNNGCQHKLDGSVIEFVIDTRSIPSEWWGNNGYVFNGNFNNSDLFKGNIERVAKQ